MTFSAAQNSFGDLCSSLHLWADRWAESSAVHVDENGQVRTFLYGPSWQRRSTLCQNIADAILAQPHYYLFLDDEYSLGTGLGTAKARIHQLLGAIRVLCRRHSDGRGLLCARSRRILKFIERVHGLHRLLLLSADKRQDFALPVGIPDEVVGSHRIVCHNIQRLNSEFKADDFSSTAFLDNHWRRLLSRTGEALEQMRLQRAEYLAWQTINQSFSALFSGPHEQSFMCWDTVDLYVARVTESCTKNWQWLAIMAGDPKQKQQLVETCDSLRKSSFKHPALTRLVQFVDTSIEHAEGFQDLTSPLNRCFGQIFEAWIQSDGDIDELCERIDRQDNAAVAPLLVMKRAVWKPPAWDRDRPEGPLERVRRLDENYVFMWEICSAQRRHGIECELSPGSWLPALLKQLKIDRDEKWLEPELPSLASIVLQGTPRWTRSQERGFQQQGLMLHLAYRLQKRIGPSPLVELLVQGLGSHTKPKAWLEECIRSFLATAEADPMICGGIRQLDLVLRGWCDRLAARRDCLPVPELVDAWSMDERTMGAIHRLIEEQLGVYEREMKRLDTQALVSLASPPSVAAGDKEVFLRLGALKLGVSLERLKEIGVREPGPLWSWNFEFNGEYKFDVEAPKPELLSYAGYEMTQVLIRALALWIHTGWIPDSVDRVYAPQIDRMMAALFPYPNARSWRKIGHPLKPQ